MTGKRWRWRWRWRCLVFSLVVLTLGWLSDLHAATDTDHTDQHGEQNDQDTDQDDLNYSNATTSRSTTTLVATGSVTAHRVVTDNTTLGLDAPTKICRDDKFASTVAIPLGNSPITIKSLVLGDQVCLEFVLQVSGGAGWFAVGFAREESMVSSPPASVLLFQKHKPAPIVYVIRGYDESDTTPIPDQAVIAPFGVVSQGNTLGFTFQRALAAASSTQVAIDVTKPSTLIWAYGRSWPISGHKTGTYGIASYDFSTLKSTNLRSNQFCDNNNCSVVFGGAAFALMLLGGLAVTCTRRRVALSHWLLHRSLMNPPTKTVSNARIQWSPRTLLVQTCSDLYFGELAIALVFVVALVALAIGSSNDSSTSLTGKLAVICLMFLFLPISRVPWLWQRFFGSSFERMVKFHRWLGMGMIILLIVHLITAIGNTDIFDLEQDGQAVPFYGTIAAICFAVMALLAFGPIRRIAFELFYYPHRVLWIVGIVFAILHTDYVGKAMIFSLAVYGISLLWQWLKCVKYLSMNASLKLHQSQSHASSNDSSFVPGTVSVLLQPTSKTRLLASTMDPCSYFWIQVSAVSMVQWHPFSAIVAPHQESIGFVTKSMGKGSFSDKLVQLAKANTQAKVTLCGPFGRIGLDLDDYEVVILVAGGVGITPFLSLLNQRTGRGDAVSTVPSKENDAPRQEFYVIWSVREVEDLLMIDEFVGGDPENLQDDSQGPRVNWMRHVSKAKGTAVNGQEELLLRRPNGQELSYLPGRPILDEVINSSRFGNKANQVAVLACGPPTLVAEAQEKARACHFDFHKEVFGW